MKLAFAFDLMDEDQDGILTKRGLWKYFRAFLASLMTIAGGASSNTNSEDIITLCDDCAVWTAAKLLESLRSPNSNGSQSGGCTFKDLADWYTQGGYQIATWLELLDLSKWLPLRGPVVQEDESDTSEGDVNESSSQSSESDNGNGYESQFMQGKKDPENPYVDEDGPEIFRSDLLDGASALSLVESDSNFVLEISQLTGFSHLTPQLLIERLQEFSCDDVITIGEYNAFVSSSVPDNLVSIPSPVPLSRLCFLTSLSVYLWLRATRTSRRCPSPCPLFIMHTTTRAIISPQPSPWLLV
jgi:hypothetical protein